MDYTEIFTKAIENKSSYDFETVRKNINSHNSFYCGDWDEWADIHWYRLTPESVVSYDKCYGFLCAEYPVALLTEYCPYELKSLFDELGILNTALEEPMSCDENILRQYISYPMVFDETFIDRCDYSCDDERFAMVLKRLETGKKHYIDSSSFTMEEIR